MSIPRICIQPSISSGTPTPVLWSEIELAMKQPLIQAICDQIKLLDGNDPDRLKARMQNFANIIIDESDEIAAMLSQEGAEKVQEAWQTLAEQVEKGGNHD